MVVARSKPSESAEHKGSHPKTPRFNSLVFLQEVMLMQQANTQQGLTVQPWEIHTKMQTWLEQQGKKELLIELNKRLLETGKQTCSLADIAHLEVSVEDILSPQWQQHAEDKLSETNKKGLALVLTHQLTHHLTSDEKTQWSRLLKQEWFPTSLATFTHYDAHFEKITELFDTFLAWLDPTRAQEIYTTTTDQKISNQTILQEFSRFGITDATTFNLLNHLVEEEVAQGEWQHNLRDAQQELQNSKQFVQHMPGGRALLTTFPLDTFFKAHPEIQEKTKDTKALFLAYAQWVGTQDKPVGNALESVAAERGASELSPHTQEVILSWLCNAHQLFFTQQWGKDLLAGMAQGRISGEQLAPHYSAYLAQLYDPTQLHVDIPINDHEQGTIVFKKKTLQIDRHELDTLAHLTNALRCTWEIDVAKSSVPLAYILPRQTMQLNEAHDSTGKPTRIFPQLTYTLTSKNTQSSYQGMLALLSEPQGAVGVFSPDDYQDYYRGHTDEEPQPQHVIAKEDIKAYTFDLVPGQTYRVSSSATQPDPWAELHLIQMQAMSTGGIELHEAGELADPEEVFAAPQSSLESKIPKFFASRFIGDEDIPAEILELWHQRYPQWAPLPKAWIAQGIIAFNKTYFEQKYNLTITDIPRRINGLEVKEWIKQDPANKALWYDHILPELTALKSHEVTHRLLTFNQVATEHPFELKDVFGKQLMIDQETLCGIAEGRFPITMDEKTQEKFVTLPPANQKVSLGSIESHIARFIPWFTFDSVKRLDTKHLDAYEKDETSLADLWETATLRDAVDTIHRDMPLLLTWINRLNTVSTDLQRLTADLLKQAKKWTPLQKLVEADAASRQASRKFARDMDILTNDRATATELVKKQQDMLKNFDKYIDTIEHHMNQIHSVLRQVDLDPAEKTRIGNVLETQATQMLDIYRTYYDFLTAKNNVTEDKKDPLRADERKRIASAYRARIRERERELTARYGSLWEQDAALAQQRDALIAGGALPTDPRVTTIDAQRNTLATQRDGLANQVASLQDEHEVMGTHIDDAREEEQQEAPGESLNERFASRFSNLKGDYNAKFENGTVLFLRVSDSKRPGYGSIWVKAKLENTQGPGSTYDLVITGVTEGSAGEHLGKRIPREKSSEDLGKLIAQSKGDIYKFSPSNTPADLHTYITSKLDSSQSKVSDFKSSWNADNVNAKREKKTFTGGKEQWAPITYVGRTYEKHTKDVPDPYFYAVEQSGNTVRVTSISDNTTQLMDLDSYMMFLIDKQLMPFTDAEYQGWWKKAEARERRSSHWTDYFVSRKVLKSAIGKFPAAYKHKMEQESKFQSAILYYRFAKWLWSLGFDNVDLFHISEVLADAEGELDTNISQVIKGYQDRIGRVGEGDNSVHGAKTSELIKREIFSNYSEKTQFRQKAAGYLLYALNNGGAYFRKLADYAHQGKWVEAILGKQQHAIFMQENKELIDRVRSNPKPSDADLDLVAKKELWYIAKETQEKEYLEIFGTKFGRTVESNASDLGQVSKAGDVAKWLANSNIYEIYEAFRFGGIWNMTPKTALGALQAMADKVDDATTYSLFYKSMVQLMASGFMTSLNATGRGVVTELARRRGIPLGLLVGDPLHPYKTITLLDAIANAEKWQGMSTLSSIVSKKVPERKNINAGNFVKSQGNVMDAIDIRWNQNGYTAMEALNYKNARLFEAQEHATDEQKSVIDDYMNNAVFNWYLDRGASGRDIDGQSPFMENGIWNISPGLFQDILMRTEWVSGEFRSPAAHELRQQVGSMLQQFDGLLSQTQSYEQKKKIIQFLLKKFKIYFGNSFNKKDYDGLEWAFVDMKSESDRKWIGYESIIRHKILGEPMMGTRKKTVKDRIVDEYGVIQQKGRKVFGDPIVEETVGTMVDLFETHLWAMSREERSDIVHRVFS